LKNAFLCNTILKSFPLIYMKIKII
jgi:hypothetical protein